MSTEPYPEMSLLPVMGHIEVDNLMTLEAYAKFRQRHHRHLIAERQRRGVNLGQNMRLQFESEQTLRYQIQEMLRIERLFEEADIRAEIEAFAPLMPQGRNWSATMMLQFAEPEERRLALERLVGVEACVYLQIPHHDRVYALSQDERPTENAHPSDAQKTSAVHFVTFEFTQKMIQALLSGALVQLGCDHAHYSQACELSDEILSVLKQDLKQDLKPQVGESFT